MNLMAHRTLLLLAIITSTLVSPVPIRVWQLEDGTLKRVPPLSSLRLVRSETSADLDFDGSAETLTLSAGRAAILTKGATRWQSQQTWQVVPYHPDRLEAGCLSRALGGIGAC